MAVAAPSALTATAASSTAITLHWTNNGTYDYIYIDRKITGGSWAAVSSVGGSVTQVSNTGLTGGKEYQYRLQAVYVDEWSAYSNTATAITPLNTPTACEAICLDEDSAEITWNDNSSTESGFKIYMDGVLIQTTVANVESYTKNGLTTGHTYKFKVKAYNAITASAFSNEASVTIVDPPSKPTGLTAQAESSTTIRLNWTDNSNNETGFKIYESTNGADYGQVATVGANVKTYLRTGRTSNTQYWYKVRAYNTYGTSAYSNAADTTTFASIAAPSGLVLTPFSDTQIELTFQDNSDLEDWHQVYRSEHDANNFALAANLSPNVTFYRDTGLTANTAYDYYVRALQGATPSNNSSTENAMTMVGVPSDPSNLAISEVGTDYMVLTWTGVNNETGYRVEQSANGAVYTELCVIDANIERFKIFDLAANTQYWFQVRAYNIVGNSNYCAAANNTTLTQHVDTDFEALLREPNPELTYLCEINPKMQVAGFTLTADQTYTYEMTTTERGIDISSVLENGTAYTEKSSIATVEATASTFWFDYYNRKLYIHTSDGTDPVDYQILAEFWLYFTDYKTAGYPAVYNGNNYLALLRRNGIPDITHEIGRYYEGNYMVSSGRISFINGKVGNEYFFDHIYSTYIWENAKLILLAGGKDFTYSQFETVYTGSVKDRSIDDNSFYLDLRDLREGCERSLPPNIFTVEAYPALDTSVTQDVKIPFCFGTITDFVPVCVDTTNKIFKLHDGRIKSVTSVKKNGTVTLAADTDYFVNYQKGTISLARGYGWEDGDYLLVAFVGAVNSADESIEKGADVFKYVCNEFLGLSDSEINLDWLYYTKVHNTMTISVPLYENTSSSDIIRQLEHSIRAYSFQDIDGKIGIRPDLSAALASSRYVRNHHIFTHSQTKRLEDNFYEITIYYDKNSQTGVYEYLRHYQNEATWKYRIANALEIYTYLTNSSDAQTLIDALIALLDKETIESEVSLLLLNVMPGDIIKYSRDRFFSAAGAAEETSLRILSITKSPASGRTRFTAELV